MKGGTLTRILHTSDWHLGRTLEGRSRLEEQEQFIDELCTIVEEEAVDLVLIAGDIFDGVNPSAVAEELFYDALDRLAAGGERGVVIIAGNHDNPERLCAAGPLAMRHGITLFGLPKDHLTPNIRSDRKRAARVAAGQGWAEIYVPGCSETAVIAMLPYPSESRLNELLTSSLDEDVLTKEYSQRVGLMFAALAERFRPDTVNLGLSHLFVQGGIESDSERPIQLGGAPTVVPEALPAGAHYVALGHLHRPQKVKGVSVPTRYSGSPLAYSFSETGYAKSVMLIEAFPGQAASLKEICLSCGHPLVKWQATGGLPQVQRWIEEGKDLNAWIDLELHLTGVLSQADIQNIRRARERIVNIRPVYPSTAELVAESRAGLPLPDLFRGFYRQRCGGAEPQPELVELFMSLLNKEESNFPETVEGESA
ncbi:MAG TPA: exonuclease subunit SbcD [Desulfobacteria bacterium]|nr:exonuclease subunit SbcD [Desulfobacteria bacterium]